MAKSTKEDEPILFCKVTTNCAGEKRAKYSGGKIKHKYYQAGENVKGRAFNASPIPNGYMPVLRTLDGYVITMSNLMVLGEEQVAQIVDDKKDFDKTIKERFSLLTGSNPNGLINGQQKRSKYLINGAMIGGAGMFLYAFAKGNNKWGSTILGVLIGGFVGRMWANYRNNNS